MMIMGGGIVSYLQGYVADLSSIKLSFTIGVLCFFYLAFYAWIVKDILKKQGINFDKSA
jgi:FHS family L-fucose permease-like MFS transporter